MSDILLDAFNLPPVDAIRYLKGKGYQTSWNWYEVWQEAHAKAFTVAKAMRSDILESIRDEVTRALTEGITLAEFRKNLTPRLKALGWWGIVQDEQGRDVQLGSPYRLRTIYRTNVQTSYMAGRYKAAMAVREQRPYWQYIAVLDNKTRPAHRALHGKVFRYDDPFWQTHYPPNGWGCRCRVRTLAERDIERQGIEPEKSAGKIVTREQVVGRGDHKRTVTVHGYRTTTGDGQPMTVWTDPGWDYNPGEAGASLLGKAPAPAATPTSPINAAATARREPVSPVRSKGIVAEIPVTKYADIPVVVKAYAAAHPEVMKSGLTGFTFDKASYFMATDCRGRLYVSGRTSPVSGFNSKRELLAAFKAIRKDTPLTFNQEYACEALWHEMLHNRAVGHRFAVRGSVSETVMETLNQWVARHTYPEFLGQLGAEPAHHDQVISKGLGYAHMVRNFRRLLRELDISEARALPVMKELSWNVRADEQPNRLARELARMSGEESAAGILKMQQAVQHLRHYQDEEAYADIVKPLIGARRDSRQ